MHALPRKPSERASRHSSSSATPASMSRCTTSNGGHVVVVELGPDRIDADEPERPRPLGGRRENVSYELSGGGLLAWRDRVLEVGDDRVGRRSKRLDELPLVAARSEEEGADAGEVGGRGAVVCQTLGTCQLDSRPEVRHNRKPLAASGFREVGA